MIYLLDTHVIIWMLYDSNKIPENIKQIMIKERCCISVSSLWELAIKSSLGKIHLKQSIKEISGICIEFGVGIIGIEEGDCEIVTELPWFHRDPFDRMLIAQTKARGLTLISADDNIHKNNMQL